MIDLTQTIVHGMDVFPGEQTPSLLRDNLPPAAGYVTHRLESNMHTGTHIDAPFHVKADERSIDSFPVELFCGKACVIDVRGREKVSMQAEWTVLFRKFPIVLFCSGHDVHWGFPDYYGNYPEFDDAVASALKENGVRIAGFDSPSPDKAPFRFHSIFLSGDRFMIENLTGLKSLINATDVEFFAFPLKLHAEASLIRAVARYGSIQ